MMARLLCTAENAEIAQAVSCELLDKLNDFLQKNPALRLARMQAPGGKPMNDCDYLRGHQLEAGTQIAPEETHAE